jgi:hypothetical protein
LDLRLCHRRPDPRHLQVRDGSHLYHHFSARVRGWMGAIHAEERRSRDRGKATAVEVRATGGRRKRNWVNPDPGRPIYRGVHRICLLRFLPPYNSPQRLYSEKFVRRLRRIFH